VRTLWQTHISISPQSFDERPKLVFGREALCGSDLSHFHGRLRDWQSWPRRMGRRRNPGKETLGDVGRHPWTTVSEMELVAAVQALRSVEGRARIELYSDSEYLIYGMRAFVSRWQRQGWRNRRGTQLQHRELWTELIGLNTSLLIRWKWVKGHSGHRDQSRADELAYEAARSLRVRQKAAA